MIGPKESALNRRLAQQPSLLNRRCIGRLPVQEGLIREVDMLSELVIGSLLPLMDEFRGVDWSGSFNVCASNYAADLEEVNRDSFDLHFDSYKSRNST